MSVDNELAALEEARNMGAVQRILAYGAAVAPIFLSGGIGVRCSTPSPAELTTLQQCGVVCGVGHMKSYSPETCYWSENQNGRDDSRHRLCNSELCVCDVPRTNVVAGDGNYDNRVWTDTDGGTQK